MSIIRWLKSDGTYAEISAAFPLPVNATVNASAAALANTSAPSYLDGTTNPLSADLTGALRITGTINASSSMHATTAAPSYTNNTDNALSSNLTGDLRVIAKQNGSWVLGAGSAIVGQVGIDQTTPGTTNAVDVTNFPVTVDVNSGAKSNSTIRVVLATDQPSLSNALSVSGTFWQTTQPISAASLPLPTGAATAAKQPALGTAGSASTDVLSIQGIAGMTALAVSGTFWQATQPISASSLPLPTGASSSALQSVTQGVIGAATAPASMSVGGGVYNSSPITLTTGQSSALQFDANGYLKVNLTNGGSGGTSSNFGSAFPTAGTAIGFLNSAGTNMAAGNLDASGFLKVNVAAGGAGGGAVFGPTAVGSAAANPPVLFAGTANATATGNVQVAKVDSSGNLNTILSTGANTIGAISNTAFAATQSGTWNIGTVTTLTTCATVTSLTQFNGNAIDTNSGNKSAGTLRTLIATDALAVPLWGHGATAATAPANAQYGGHIGKTALPTAVTDGQLVGSMADKYGRHIVRSAPRELLQTASINTTSTSGTLLASQGAGVFADMYRLVIANSSAAAVLVSILDGTNTYPFEVPANGTVGFSGPAADATPAASSATAWTYTVASGTTTIYIHAQFILNK